MNVDLNFQPGIVRVSLPDIKAATRVGSHLL